MSVPTTEGSTSKKQAHGTSKNKSSKEMPLSPKTVSLEPAEDDFSKPKGQMSNREERNNIVIVNANNNHNNNKANTSKKPYDWRNFLVAQVKMVIVLAFAYVGNTWSNSFNRNDNENAYMFWAVCITAMICGVLSFGLNSGVKEADEDPVSRVLKYSQPEKMLLGREQTDEWKGWMQFAFIMYHYYRSHFVYNEIRLFVSSYVWLTGYGNFFYFRAKKDFSFNRCVGMVVRINWFPMLLCFVCGTNLELYYVVPLHTLGFFMTYLTCYLIQHVFEERCHLPERISVLLGFAVSLLCHVLIFECEKVGDFLFMGNQELRFRFSTDKYSAFLGMVCAYLLPFAKHYLQDMIEEKTADEKKKYVGFNIAFGVALMLFWYYNWGYMPAKDKKIYNQYHPFVLIMPVLGYLLVRNSTRFLRDRHGQFFAYLGKHSLETYVLQFHVFMCQNVKHILVVIPNAYHSYCQLFGWNFALHLNMVLVVLPFFFLATWAYDSTLVMQGFVQKVLCPKMAAMSCCANKSKNSSTQEEEAVLTLRSNKNISKKHRPEDTELESINGTSHLQTSSKESAELGSPNNNYINKNEDGDQSDTKEFILAGK